MAPKNPDEFVKLFNKNIPHILEKIFLSLDYKSFKRCYEVCKAWREIVGNESFRRRSKALYHDEMVDDLFNATMAANPKDISWLLFMGININTTKEFLGLNTTPLIVAVSTRNNDVVKVFLNA